MIMKLVSVCAGGREEELDRHGHRQRQSRRQRQTETTKNSQYTETVETSGMKEKIWRSREVGGRTWQREKEN
jgi:hypothetical protein